jgi:hypothetical protein
MVRATTSSNIDVSTAAASSYCVFFAEVANLMATNIPVSQWRLPATNSSGQSKPLDRKGKWPKPLNLAMYPGKHLQKIKAMRAFRHMTLIGMSPLKQCRSLSAIPSIMNLRPTTDFVAAFGKNLFGRRAIWQRDSLEILYIQKDITVC